MGMNEIYMRNTIIDFHKEGKSNKEIVDYFYDNNGVFLWGHIERKPIENKVENVIYDYQNPKPTFFEKIGLKLKRKKLPDDVNSYGANKK